LISGFFLHAHAEQKQPKKKNEKEKKEKKHLSIKTQSWVGKNGSDKASGCQSPTLQPSDNYSA
jgi:hypothetical protein